MSASAGRYVSLALTAQGALFSFEWGGNGQLGHGDKGDQPQPKRVAALTKERVVDAATGGDHSLALTAEGAVFSFGVGAQGQLGHGGTAARPRPEPVAALAKERVVGVAAGRFHSLASTAGALFGFGQGVKGQLGHGDRTNRPRPKRVRGRCGGPP